jgi:hypothetical protein
VSKVKKGVIRLSAEATNSMSVMLMELSNADKSVKICHSQLASFILTEFHSRHFERAKPRLIIAHQDKKKFIMDKIESMDLENLEATIKYLDKIKKEDSSNENLDSTKTK